MTFFLSKEHKTSSGRKILHPTYVELVTFFFFLFFLLFFILTSLCYFLYKAKRAEPEPDMLA